MSFSLPPTGVVSLLPSVQVGPFDCRIETRKYEVRSGKGWMNVSPADYGYIDGYIGADGDFIDCYIGPNPDSRMVYVVDQNRRSDYRNFDEHKCMLGYDSQEEALSDFIKGHHEGRQILRAITPMTFSRFLYWLNNGDLTKPLRRA